MIEVLFCDSTIFKNTIQSGTLAIHQLDLNRWYQRT